MCKQMTNLLTTEVMERLKKIHESRMQFYDRMIEGERKMQRILYVGLFFAILHVIGIIGRIFAGG